MHNANHNMVLHIKIWGLLYSTLFYSICSILGALMSFIFVYSDLVFREFHPMNFNLIYFYLSNKCLPTMYSFSYIDIESQWNKCEGLKTFFQVKRDVWNACYSQKQSGGLVSWGSELLKDCSLYQPSSQSWKTGGKKNEVSRLHLTQNFWDFFFFFLNQECHRIFSTGWVTTKQLEDSSSFHCLVSKMCGEKFEWA